MYAKHERRTGEAVDGNKNGTKEAELRRWWCWLFWCVMEHCSMLKSRRGRLQVSTKYSWPPPPTARLEVRLLGYGGLDQRSCTLRCVCWWLPRNVRIKWGMTSKMDVGIGTKKWASMLDKYAKDNVRWQHDFVCGIDSRLLTSVGHL